MLDKDAIDAALAAVRSDTDPTNWSVIANFLLVQHQYYSGFLFVMTHLDKRAFSFTRKVLVAWPSFQQRLR